MSDEPIVQAPPFVQACRVLDHLWMASNAISFIPGRKAEAIRGALDELRGRFERDVLPAVLRKETLG